MNRPRIRDPRAVPVVGIDAYLPPVSALALTPNALRTRMASSTAWTPEFTGDGISSTDRTPHAAAVLMALVQRPSGLHVLLTQRSAHLRDHAGQVSFPGGRSEAHDASPAATALREAHEEVGLQPSTVEILGTLPSYTTVTQFVVTPVLGLVLHPPTYQPDHNEVETVFEVPLAYLMTPANHRRHRYEHDGVTRHFLSMPWPDTTAPEGERFIWGATAAMLRNVYRMLSA
jgi:8-oxo-dGTP pyrophosphatase MutT (NUDIX family)